MMCEAHVASMYCVKISGACLEDLSASVSAHGDAGDFVGLAPGYHSSCQRPWMACLFI